MDGPQHGTLRLRADGSFVYTPVAGYTGPDSFTYSAAHCTDTSAPVAVTLSITAGGSGSTALRDAVFARSSR